MKRKIFTTFLLSTICIGLLAGCSKSETTGEILTPESIELNTEQNTQVNTQEDMFQVDLPDVNINSISKEEIDEPSITIPEPVEPSIDYEIKEYIDFTSLEEIPMKEDLYKNIDIKKLMPNEKAELRIKYEDLMEMIISYADETSYFKLASDNIIYEMYNNSENMYSHAKSISTNQETYSFAKIDASEFTDSANSLTSEMGPTDYESKDIIYHKQIASLKDKNGRIFDVLEVAIDPREEDEKDMLAYETEDGIMYLDKDAQMTVNGVKYGGEDGVQPLEKIPYDIHKFFIERETKELKGLIYTTDGMDITMHINKLDSLEIPKEFKNAKEITSDEIGMEMLSAVMTIVMEQGEQ